MSMSRPRCRGRSSPTRRNSDRSSSICLGNAVKFTNHGQVTLRVAELPPASLRFEVADTGVGIAPDEMVDIFDPFKQVEAGKAAGGTGLGLAITKRLADALEAVVDVESEVGKGSTFSVTLPLVEATTDDWSTLPEETGDLDEHLVLADGVDCTILIADDRDTNRDVLHGMLDCSRFQDTAGNGWGRGFGTASHLP